jgi:DNA-binding SARP family transcriptional activator
VGRRQQRLIAALALRGPASRRVLAGLLWPESSEDQSADSVRVSVFRITHDLPRLLADGRDPLALNPDGEVDVDAVNRMIDEIERPGTAPVVGAAELLRTAELLPGWYDDWVLYERERLQQRRMAALEILATRFLTQGSLFYALDAARLAISIEPLRESAQLILVRALMAAEDNASALVAYRDFSDRLADELGVAPSPQFAEILHARAVAAMASRTVTRGAARLRPSPGSLHRQ